MGQTIKSKNGNFYQTAGGETLRDIAQETGTDYDTLLKLNPSYGRSRIGIGRKILLEADTGGKTAATAKTSEAKETQAEEKSEETAQSKTESDTAAEKLAAAREKARQRAIKKEKYDSDIKNAQNEYELNVSSAQNDYEAKVNKLASALRDNAERLKTDMAARKLTDSSIAENSLGDLSASAENEISAEKQALNISKAKLKNKLDRTVADAKRKIAAL